MTVLPTAVLPLRCGWLPDSFVRFATHPTRQKGKELKTRHATSDPREASGLSRREAVFAVSASGLAAALFIRGMGYAGAQDAAPTPAYAAGVTAEILGRIEPPAAPGYTLQLVRVTFAPDAVVAAHRHSGGTVTTQMSGSHSFTVSGPARRLPPLGLTPASRCSSGRSTRSLLGT